MLVSREVVPHLPDASLNGTFTQALSHEVNYFLWGAANALASEKGADVTETSMLSWIYGYRTFAFGDSLQIVDQTPYDGSVSGRAAWAKAGWSYIKTGNVGDDILDYRIPNADPTIGTHYERPVFFLQLGEYELNETHLK